MTLFNTTLLSFLIFFSFSVNAQDRNLSRVNKTKLKSIIIQLDYEKDSILNEMASCISSNIQLEDSISILTKTDSLTIIFTGDIMGHDPQIKSAYNPKSKNYNYDLVFKEVKNLISKADYSIANLEVTLAGPPYKGYPKFSSPDALAAACKSSGIDVLVTSNNHSCDRGKEGLIRTLDVLDSLEIMHTGTFRDSTEWKRNNLLILEENNIRIGLLNYTYGTNGLPTPLPTIVNRIDTVAMLLDIENSKQVNLDKLIVMIHWGPEYKSYPSSGQKNIAKFLFRNGVDIIVGSHPHVLQKMEYFENCGAENGQFIAYSLGNYVSNQRARRKDGGAMLELTLTKKLEKVSITDFGYHLTWVHKSINNGKELFKIVSCAKYEEKDFKGLDLYSTKAMKTFINDSRSLFSKENKNVKEKKN